MLILILDDVKVRHDAFDRIYAGHEIVHANSFSACVAALDGKRVFDLVHLDHDLDEFADSPDFFVDGWGKTRFFNGGHVVRHIGAMSSDKLPREVIVHSINSYAAPHMVADLRNIGVPAVWVPFGDLEIDHDVDGEVRYDY